MERDNCHPRIFAEELSKITLNLSQYSQSLDWQSVKPEPPIYKAKVLMNHL
jgi:hypothetical protein